MTKIETSCLDRLKKKDLHKKAIRDVDFIFNLIKQLSWILKNVPESHISKKDLEKAVRFSAAVYGRYPLCFLSEKQRNQICQEEQSDD